MSNPFAPKPAPQAGTVVSSPTTPAAPATSTPAPTPTAPVTMPDPTSPAVLEARRRATSAASTLARNGRSGTILTTAGSRTLAGGGYSGRVTGG